MNIEHTVEFEKDLKKLSKKYRTLSDDLKNLKKAICSSPEGNGTKHWNLITSLGENSVYKVRLASRSVGGDKLRVIYKYNKGQVVLLFIELYFKGDKVNEDAARIKKYCNNRKNST
ncbi:hypothetical protein COV81_05630 [Candidatus Peregrinibacteria bacterium CG11_big_fil_rev_8_21_14_0_20_41_10]|nr:MAG: hypothetical protein COV81_05630 [Candidatus Peregrinibacteria bacterium CG11_big_fil_rev_8_21_14_0_20_41_10]PIZ75766.1 MAG: hypothetical protein COY06_02485 [Candidatus Peregrinibacteria bacterium CG_4_10_14_0_2_um_filter_41_8]PJC38421.1 MAG: hypothetical protein CO045_00240 [Candidatus Peregrinibacteria bacterium CG_4_9_14_0_2_um_filter_41_14]